jgi:hypothetical protein
MGILRAGRARGVTDYMMAKQTGRTIGGIRFKLDRHLGTLPPSMRPGAKKAVRDRAASATVGTDGPSAAPLEEAPTAPDLALLDGLEEPIAQLLDLLSDAEIGPDRGPYDRGRIEAAGAFDAALAALVTEHYVPLRILGHVLGRSYGSLARRLRSHLGADPARAALAAAGEDLDDAVGDGDDGIPDAALGEEVPAGAARAGWLTDFTPETTPIPAATAPAPAQVDPAAQHASHTSHMALMRALRQVAVAAGHAVQAWDVGQDVCFVHGKTLVNVEVKSVGGGVEQYRLGLGQLLEQVQHHLDHLATGHPWYADAGIEAVAAVLVVTDERVAPAWQRLADRLGIAIWPAERALAVFADTHAPGLPPGQVPGTCRMPPRLSVEAASPRITDKSGTGQHRAVGQPVCQ